MDKRFINNLDEIWSILNSELSYNFFAVAVTQWNALSIDVLLRQLSEFNTIKACIVIQSHFNNGFLIDESFFTNTCSSYFYLDTSVSKVSNVKHASKSIANYYKGVFNLLKHDRNTTTLFYSTYDHSIPEAVLTQNIQQVINRPFCVCYTEEGIGAYMGTFNNTYGGWKQVNSFRSLHAYVRYSLFGRYVYRLFHKTYSSLLYNENLLGLKVNYSILPYYRKVFEERSKSINSVIDIEKISKSVVLCTTGWYRDDIIDDEDFRVYLDICGTLNKMGIPVILKAHPRDLFFPKQSNQLKCIVLDEYNLTIEGICSMVTPIAIFAFSSTALVNAKLFWNVTTICLTDLLDRSKLGSKILAEIDAFKTVFGKEVIYLSDPNEIRGLLNNKLK